MRSSPDAGEVVLPFVCCRARALSKLATYFYFPHCDPHHSQAQSVHTPQAAPLSISSHVFCWYMLSCLFLLYVCRIGFCCAGLCSATKAIQLRLSKSTLPEYYLDHNFDEHCLEGTLSPSSDASPTLVGGHH